MALIHCPECGAEISDQALACPKCGNPVPRMSQTPQAPQAAPATAPATEQDVPNVGLNVLSFLIPLAGLILYLTSKDATPLKAKACGKWAIRGLIFGIIISIIILIVYPLIVASAIFSAF